MIDTSKWLKKYIWLLLISPFSGCLPSDSGITSEGQAKKDVLPLVKKQSITSAPAFIDSVILAERRFKEAPMLKLRVQQGQLPPVSERLPVKPLIVVPINEIGTYGGTLRRALTGDIAQVPGPSKALSDNLMGYERPRPNSIQLNMAESYQFLDGGKTVIFKIRKGIKWSDGVLFTVDDILFSYYDMMFDDNAREDPIPITVWMIKGKPISMEKIDDFTLRISSPNPLGRVLNALCSDNFAHPKHVLARLHPRYNPKAKYETFRDSTTAAQLIMKPGIPRLSAWVPVKWVRGQRIVYERNPYYWKVDSAGNQLPYADRLVFTLIRDPQVILLKFINGEIDLYGRYSRVDMFPTLKSQVRNGKFKFQLAQTGSGPAFYLNYDCPKPALREAFRNRQVRIALSHGVNRGEIGEIAWYGLLEPGGYSFSSFHPYFSRTDFKRYTQFDPEKSRRILDRAGYPDKDGDGYRELKDGSRFEMNIDVVAPGAGLDVCTLVKSHWEEIGIKVNLNGALRDIIWPRRMNGEFDIHYWGLEAPQDPLVRPNDWAAMGPTVPFWHRNASTEGPVWLDKATQYIRKAITSVDTASVRDFMVQAQRLHSENAGVIATGSAFRVWGYSTRLGNVPQNLLMADVFRGFGRAMFHEQLYIIDNK